MGQHRDMWGTAGIYGARTGDVAPQGSMGQRRDVWRSSSAQLWGRHGYGAAAHGYEAAHSYGAAAQGSMGQHRDMWGTAGMCGARTGDVAPQGSMGQRRDVWRGSSAQLWSSSAGLYGAAQGSMGQAWLWGTHR